MLKKLYDKFVTKFNAIDNQIPSVTEFVSKTHYDSDKQVLERKIKDVDKKIPNTNGLVKKLIKKK